METIPTPDQAMDEAALGPGRLIPAAAVEGPWIAPDGWPLRHLRWPLPERAEGPRGSLLFLGGRGDHYEKYCESFADWRARGWCVESVDWRGQGGSGRLTADANVGHVDDFAIWISDIEAFVAEWHQRTPGPHIVVAHSMGGHLAVRALAERRLPVDAAILIAPMIGFLAPYPDWLGLKVAQMMGRIGPPERAAWKASEKPGSPLKLRQLLLTHDDRRYADELWWHDQRPGLRLGPGSWGWIAAAYDSFLKLKAPGGLEGIATPCLFLAASADKLVSPAATRRDAARMPGARIHIYGHESAHEILREVDAVRDDALARIDAFLADVLAGEAHRE